MMNNTDLTKRQLGVNPGVHEQHEPNQRQQEMKLNQKTTVNS